MVFQDDFKAQMSNAFPYLVVSMPYTNVCNLQFSNSFIQKEAVQYSIQNARKSSDNDVKTYFEKLLLHNMTSKV